MKNLSFLVIFLFIATASIAQTGKDTAIAVKDSSFDDEKIIFSKVEEEANFPGGDAAWRKYLQNNLDPNTPVKNGAKKGTYQVIIRFVVMKDGKISDVVAETSFGYGMETEAIRVIKHGPKWEPAVQNGRKVNAYRRQPITFVVDEK